MSHLDSGLWGTCLEPLYKLITETQQAQTNKLVWSSETQKTFKSLQTALLQAPALSLPIGSEFSFFVTGKKKKKKSLLPHCLRVIATIVLVMPNPSQHQSFPMSQLVA